jgi:hypothetical protein
MTRLAQVLSFQLAAESRVKLCHHAALALLGWWLIMPPTSIEYPRGKVDAPLSKWVKTPTTYRSRDECEHVLDRQRKLLSERNRQLKLKVMANAQCIASDDPRLKAGGE